MLPYKSLISLNRTLKTPLYQQLANQIIQLIKANTLVAGTRLPSSRALSDELDIHRKTVVSGYEELILQGWLETRPQQGTYVQANLPVLQSKTYSQTKPSESRHKAGFVFNVKDYYETPNHPFKDIIYINDGIPDVRLSPTKQIGQFYKEISNHNILKPELGYGSPLGTLKLRQVLSHYIHNTRGVQVQEDEILITRGSQMGIYLAAKALINPNDILVVGETNYRSADLTFESFGSQLIRIGVDEHGLMTQDLEQLCIRRIIKAVYVTSHHHHPTTVTLSAERRIHLLNLAQKYKFAIIEDDYDYDFHYKRSPILPLGAHDTHNNVIYIGSLCKTVAPAYRIGYLIASKDFVKTCSNHRRFIDRQGDYVLEYAFARFIESGNLTKHINKVMKIYEERRTYFCNLLKSELAPYLDFISPTGGMAVWLTLKEPYTWSKVSKMGVKFGIDFGEWERYDYGKQNHQSIRMGFANYTKDETYDLINKLKSIFINLNN